jgi:hypothetical protein
MPNGKPAGVPCIQLTPDLRCSLFGDAARPSCCSGLQASPEMCGADRQDALLWLTRLEVATQPDDQDRGGRSISVCGMPSSR